MNKKILVGASLLILLLSLFTFYIGKKAIGSRTGDTIYDKIAQKFSEPIKLKIKKTFFKSDFLQQEIYLKEKLIHELKI